MAIRPPSSEPKSLFSTPSEIKFEGAFRGSPGTREHIPIAVSFEAAYEPQFPNVIKHIEPTAPADGDPHILEGWPAHFSHITGRRIPWTANIQPIRDWVYGLSISTHTEAPPEPLRQLLSWDCQYACKKAIHELLTTAGEQNWDGADADPVLNDTVQVALGLVESLPSDVGIPEISADPEGNIEFDWHLDNGTMLTVSVGRAGDIAISGLCPEQSRISGMVEDREGITFSLLQCGLEWLREMQERN